MPPSRAPAVGLVVAVLLLSACGRSESAYADPIRAELADFSDMIVAVTAQSETTAVVETTLSSYEHLDLGPAMGMCAYLEIATNPALQGLAAVRVESRSGDVLYSCIVDL